MLLAFYTVTLEWPRRRTEQGIDSFEEHIVRRDKPTGKDVAQYGRRAAIKMAGVGIAATLAASSAAQIVRAEDASKTAPPPPEAAPLQSEFVYEALVTVAAAMEIGASSHGVRRYIPITGGSFHGPKIKGVVLPGGADWQLQRPDGVLEVDALYSMKADNGDVIIVHNRGLIVGDTYIRTAPQFEAPIGANDWLNKSVFIGSLTGAPQPGAVVIRVFRVL
jgi:hypothetical protein